MKLIFLLILYLNLHFLILCHPKGDKLRELTLESETGLINFNEKMYNE